MKRMWMEFNSMGEDTPIQIDVYEIAAFHKTGQGTSVVLKSGKMYYIDEPYETFLMRSSVPWS